MIENVYTQICNESLQRPWPAISSASLIRSLARHMLYFRRSSCHRNKYTKIRPKKASGLLLLRKIFMLALIFSLRESKNNHVLLRCYQELQKKNPKNLKSLYHLLTAQFRSRKRTALSLFYNPGDGLSLSALHCSVSFH